MKGNNPAAFHAHLLQHVTVRRFGAQVSSINSRFLMIGALLLLSLGLRVFSLGSQSVWIDEAYSFRLAGQEASSIIAQTARDNHPPLYYLLLAGWVRLGTPSEAWGRLLSALLGTAVVGMVYLFARELLPHPVPLIAAALLTISPLSVWHSQDARMYSLMLFCAYLSLTLLLTYLRTARTGIAIAFTVSLIASLYTHLYMCFLLPVIVLYVWILRRELSPTVRRAVLVSLVLAIVSFLPWIWTVLHSAMRHAGFYKPITLFSLPYTFYAFSVGYSLGPSVAEMHQNVKTLSVPMNHLPVVAVAGILFGIVFLAGLASLWNRRRGKPALLYLLLSLPILLAVLVTLVSSIDFNARYAIISFPAYLLFLATGLCSIRSRWLEVAMGIGLVGLMGASLFNYFWDRNYAKEDARAACRWVETHGGPRDCVLVLGVRPAFQYYEGTALRSEWLDFRNRNQLANNEAVLERWARECPRLWFVLGRSWEEDPLELAVPTLGKYFDRVEETVLTGVRVLEFQPRNGSEQAARGGS